MEEKKVYVKSAQKNIIAQHYRPTFKYLFDEEPIEVLEEHANFLVKSNPSMFSIAKGYKPKATKKEFNYHIDFDKATKDNLLDYTAKHDIEADYSMTKEQLISKIKEVLQ